MQQWFFAFRMYGVLHGHRLGHNNRIKIGLQLSNSMSWIPHSIRRKDVWLLHYSTLVQPLVLTVGRNPRCGANIAHIHPDNGPGSPVKKSSSDYEFSNIEIVTAWWPNLAEPNNGLECHNSIAEDALRSSILTLLKTSSRSYESNIVLSCCNDNPGEFVVPVYV